jgi:hypothetical protein
MPFLREVAGYTAMDSKMSNALQRNWNNILMQKYARDGKIHDACPNVELRSVRRSERTCPVNREAQLCGL